MRQVGNARVGAGVRAPVRWVSKETYLARALGRTTVGARENRLRQLGREVYSMLLEAFDHDPKTGKYIWKPTK